MHIWSYSLTITPQVAADKAPDSPAGAAQPAPPAGAAQPAYKGKYLAQLLTDMQLACHANGSLQTLAHLHEVDTDRKQDEIRNLKEETECSRHPPMNGI